MHRAIRSGCLGLMLAAAPAMAVQTQTGFQFSEDFEGYALGPLELGYSYNPPATTFLLTGGSIALGSFALPARSGTQVYASSGSIRVDPQGLGSDYWHGARVHVSGSAVVTFTATRIGGGSFSLVSPLNARNHGFSFTTDDIGGYLPYINTLVLSSDAPFAIDDLVLGEPSLSPPVPEPATWAMFVVGFGLAGLARRRQRALAAPGGQLHD